MTVRSSGTLARKGRNGLGSHDLRRPPRQRPTLQMRNILAKLPRLMQAKMKGLVQQVFLAPSYAAALKRGRDLIAKFKDRYPAAMECLERDLEECVTYLRFPEAHHRRIRTTNRLERLNGEGRRRTKVIPRFPTERSCLTLLYASLMAASKLWRGLPMTAAMLRQLAQLKTEAAPAPKEAVA
jgi:putative transposase